MGSALLGGPGSDYLLGLLGGLELLLVSSPAAALAPEREGFKQNIATDAVVKRLIRAVRKQESILQDE